MEKKTAAIRYFCNRLKQYQLSPVSSEKENNVILQILHNNGYDASVTERLFKKTRNIVEKDQKNSGSSLPTSGG